MPLARLLAANDTTAGTSIADPADTATDPIGTTGVIDMTGGDEAAGFEANGLVLVPYGTDTAAETFLMSAFAISKVLVGGVPIWTYHLLASFTCTLCTKAASTVIGASALYCDTITLGVGNSNVSVEVVSPTGNQAGHVVLDTKGAMAVALKFARNGSAASANCLYRKV